MIPDMPMDCRFWSKLGSARCVCFFTLALGGCGQTPYDPSAQTPLNTIEVLGESGTQLGQFVYPRGMDVYYEGNEPRAVIVDKTARIQTIDLHTGQILGAVHTPRWNRGKPTGLTVAASLLDHTKRAVYVADTHEHRVLMYELPLPPVEVPEPTEPDFMFGAFGEEPGQFIYPTDVAIDTDETGKVAYVYISEYGGNDRISRFRVERTAQEAPSFIFEYQIGIVGEEVDASDFPTALSRPQSIELWTNPAGAQELIVTDASHHRVGRLSIKGELIAWFGDPLDTSELAYRFPYGLTILEDDTALITEFGSNRVRCIDIETGETLWRYGERGRGVGQLAQPWASGVIGDQLVILDSGNSRVQVCELPAGISKIGQEQAQGQLFGRAGSP